MIERVYRRAVQARGVARVVVATDDFRIAETVEDFGGSAMMTSADARSGTDRVAEAAARLGLSDADIVVNVQGDQPLLDPRNVEAVTAPFLEEPGVQMTTLAFRIVDEREMTDPKDVKVVFDRKGDALYFSRSTIPFARDPSPSCDRYKHLGIYAYRRGFLEEFCRLPEGELERIEKLEQLRVLEWGHRIRVAVTDFDSPEVDVPEDIPRIEKRLRHDQV
jgi:3-deoxy-manno-octulosonate cytidylyltransferase (CMP-KDO synthetase)